MMASKRRHYEDSYLTRFDATIAAVGEWNGSPAVDMEETWFYAEMGGQLGDRGRLGDVAVTDVQVTDDGRVWHVVEALPEAWRVGVTLAAEIDWARRFDHMQQHTGQHVLSAALEREFDCATLSSTLGAERCVIEIAMPK